MDFFRVVVKNLKDGKVEVYPDFQVSRSKDLMVRGRAFYAIWDIESNLWSTDEYDVQRIVDAALDEECAKHSDCTPKYLRSFGSNSWNNYRRFVAQVSDNAHQLDESLTFANTQVKKNDYVSRRVSYSLEEGDHSAWDELVSTLYSPEERAKIEWAIGAILSGDSKKIQKFLVFHGPGGTGKSTILNIVQKLFGGYYVSFEAKALVGNSNTFSTEVFRGNPLVAIQHDGDLSKIEDNSKLNSIISHEDMTMNEKYKPSYTSRINAFLLMGTNKPVRISDAKSGIIRRLIDVYPTGARIPINHYNTLLARVEFELGAIAHHCLETYRSMGKNYYNAYRPIRMMLQTDVFFNFVEAYFDVFKAQDGISLKQAYALYKEYCAETGIEHVLPQYKFRGELSNYFEEFLERTTIDGTPTRSYYSGFTAHLFKAPVEDKIAAFSLVLEETTSLFDELYSGQPAQMANAAGNPTKYWTDDERLINGVMKRPRPDQVVSTVLSDLDTTQVHFVKVPTNHIVIDFDLKGEDGGKSLERNLEAASLWPPTYAELSKSGSGVHLHYIYEGDATELDSNYSREVEIKQYSGNSALRRRLSRCNNVPIVTINGGLPLKEKKVLTADTIKSERGLRDLIARNLRKEIHPGTKPSIDFIEKILNEAYESKMAYDVTDMRGQIVAFANNSTNQAMACLKAVQRMKFQSYTPVEAQPIAESSKDERLVFFDAEVYPNLFVVCWSYEESDTVVRMINPKPQEIEALFEFRLIGFNNRRYDNHILWARYLGYTNEQLYQLSQRLIENDKNALFAGAYDVSYTDIYDFSSKKQGLKKFQIDLGIHHLEIDIPWDQPVPEERWGEVADYCANDVISSKVVFNDRKQDFVARQILCELSGLTVNDTTQKHTARIIFGADRNPQKSFIYTKLEKDFPGYEFDKGKSTYRGEVVGEGGYVYAEPGMYDNVALLDVASMHPASIEQLNLFGEYTGNFAALTRARLAIKRKEYSEARKMLGGKLAPYLRNEEDAGALSYALKIIINIVYGLTSAKFDNPFRDVRNKDNIVAKRGALFMIDLKHAVQEQGFTVAHIKTDSIKIPDATPEIIEFVKQFGEKYGYEFEYKPEEDVYDKFCLVNDAVYIARSTVDAKLHGDNGTAWTTKWTAVGAQFQHPYVFKTLFTKEPIQFADLCEAKSVSKGAMWLDFDAVQEPMFNYEGMHFVGRTGLFVPVVSGGGILQRVSEDKRYAVTGTKGYFWVEAEHAKTMDPELIDMRYFEKLAKDAYETIDYFGPFADLVS